jgi:hypothetical protein
MMIHGDGVGVWCGRIGCNGTENCTFTWCDGNNKYLPWITDCTETCTFVRCDDGSHRPLAVDTNNINTMKKGKLLIPYLRNLSSYLND